MELLQRKSILQYNTRFYDVILTKTKVVPLLFFSQNVWIFKIHFVNINFMRKNKFWEKT